MWNDTFLGWLEPTLELLTPQLLGTLNARRCVPFSIYSYTP